MFLEKLNISIIMYGKEDLAPIIAGAVGAVIMLSCCIFAVCKYRSNRQINRRIVAAAINDEIRRAHGGYGDDEIANIEDGGVPVQPRVNHRNDANELLTLPPAWQRRINEHAATREANRRAAMWALGVNNAQVARSVSTPAPPRRIGGSDFLDRIQQEADQIVTDHEAEVAAVQRQSRQPQQPRGAGADTTMASIVRIAAARGGVAASNARDRVPVVRLTAEAREMLANGGARSNHGRGVSQGGGSVAEGGGPPPTYEQATAGDPPPYTGTSATSAAPAQSPTRQGSQGR